MQPAPTLTGERLTLVLVAPEHAPDLRRILALPEIHRRWGDEPAPDWPLDDDPELVRYAVLVDGAVRGLVQYAEEPDPMYRHASVDLVLDPAVHGHGYGTEMLRLVARHLFRDRGHHRLTIDPAADNEPAIRCYSKAGFRPVGILRRYERDADGACWHDGLLMDLLVEDLTDDAG